MGHMGETLKMRSSPTFFHTSTLLMFFFILKSRTFLSHSNKFYYAPNSIIFFSISKGLTFFLLSFSYTVHLYIYGTIAPGLSFLLLLPDALLKSKSGE